jgi:hypothetical protein
VSPQHRSRTFEQVPGSPGVQRFAADHRTDAPDWYEIRGRNGAAPPEKQRENTETLASGINGKGAEFAINRIGERGQEKPMMITSHPNTLADFGFICMLIVKLIYRCHYPSAISGNDCPHSLGTSTGY